MNDTWSLLNKADFNDSKAVLLREKESELTKRDDYYNSVTGIVEANNIEVSSITGSKSSKVLDILSFRIPSTGTDTTTYVFNPFTFDINAVVRFNGQQNATIWKESIKFLGLSTQDPISINKSSPYDFDNYIMRENSYSENMPSGTGLTLFLRFTYGQLTIAVGASAVGLDFERAPYTISFSSRIYGIQKNLLFAEIKESNYYDNEVERRYIFSYRGKQIGSPTIPIFWNKDGPQECKGFGNFDISGNIPSPITSWPENKIYFLP